MARKSFRIAGATIAAAVTSTLIVPVGGSVAFAADREADRSSTSIVSDIASGLTRATRAVTSPHATVVDNDTYVKDVHKNDDGTYTITLNDNDGGKAKQTRWTIDIRDGVQEVTTKDNGNTLVVKTLGSDGKVTTKEIPIGSVTTWTLDNKTHEYVINNGRGGEYRVPARDTYLKSVSSVDKNTGIVELVMNTGEKFPIQTGYKGIKAIKATDNGTKLVISYLDGRADTTVDLQKNPTFTVENENDPQKRTLVVTPPTGNPVRIPTTDTFITGVDHNADGSSTIKQNNGKSWRIEGLKGVSFDPKTSTMTFEWSDGKKKPTSFNLSTGYPDITVSGEGANRVLRITPKDGGAPTDLKVPDTFISSVTGPDTRGRVTLNYNDGTKQPLSFVLPNHVIKVFHNKVTSELEITWRDSKTPTKIPLTKIAGEREVNGVTVIRLTDGTGKQFDVPVYNPATTIASIVSDPTTGNLHVMTADGKNHDVIVGDTIVGAHRDKENGNLVLVKKDGTTIPITMHTTMITPGKDGTATIVSPGKNGVFDVPGKNSDDARVRVVTRDIYVTGFETNKEKTQLILHRADRVSGEKLPDLSVDLPRSVDKIYKDGDGNLIIGHVGSDTLETIPMVNAVISKDGETVVVSDGKGGSITLGKYNPKTQVKEVVTTKTGDTEIIMNDGVTRYTIPTGDLVKDVTYDKSTDSITVHYANPTLPPATFSLRDRITVVDNGNNTATITTQDGEQFVIPLRDVKVTSITEKDGLFTLHRSDGTDLGPIGVAGAITNVETGDNGALVFTRADGTKTEVRVGEFTAAVTGSGMDQKLVITPKGADPITVDIPDVHLVKAESKGGEIVLTRNDGKTFTVKITDTVTNITVNDKGELVYTSADGKTHTVQTSHSTFKVEGSGVDRKLVVTGPDGTKTTFDLADLYISDVTTDKGVATITRNDGEKWTIKLDDTVTNIVANDKGGFDIIRADGSKTSIDLARDTYEVRGEGQTRELVFTAPDGTKTVLAIPDVYVTNVVKDGDTIRITRSDGQTWEVTVSRAVANIGLDENGNPVITYVNGEKLVLAQATIIDNGDGTVTVTNVDGSKVTISKAGEKGDPGKDGLNAFELWRQIPGNETKTLEDFVGAMKGDPGKDGKNGKDAYLSSDLAKCVSEAIIPAIAIPSVIALASWAAGQSPAVQEAMHNAQRANTELQKRIGLWNPDVATFVNDLSNNKDAQIAGQVLGTLAVLAGVAGIGYAAYDSCTRAGATINSADGNYHPFVGDFTRTAPRAS